jgi:hypothetical protein
MSLLPLPLSLSLSLTLETLNTSSKPQSLHKKLGGLRGEEWNLIYFSRVTCMAELSPL